MPRLEDIKNGNFVVTDRTSLSHNGQVYRGKKQINELVDRVLPDSEGANDSKANKAARKLSKADAKKRDDQQAAASPAPTKGGNKPAAAATPPAEAPGDTTDAK